MTNFDLKTLGLADGDYEITVVARADGYLPSPPSNAVDYAVGSGETLLAGLYDANNTLVASWDTLVNDYGMRCDIAYTAGNFDTETTSPYYVLTNNSELANGVKLVIGNDIKKIGNYAFYECSSLRSIKIPDSVASIGERAFYYCRSLTSIEIPDGVTSIGFYAFYFCTSLTSVIIGNSVTSIGGSAFSYCNKLTSIEIPDSVTSIGSWVFGSCSRLTSVKIGNSVTSIGNYAFYSCSSLTSIIIPDSVTSIGEKAFYNCISLETIYCEVAEVNKPSGWDSNWKNGCDATVVWGYKPLITFTLDGTTYQAENGMTWAEWCDSEYRSPNYKIYNNYLVDAANYSSIINTEGVPQRSSDVIIANHAYRGGFGSND